MKARKPKKLDGRQEELNLGEHPTVEQLFAHYAASAFPDHKKTTRQAYGTTFRATLKRFGPKARPRKEEYREWLRGEVTAGRLMASTANRRRDHLHAVYVLYRDEKWGLLINAAAFKRFAEEEKKPEGFTEPYKSWPRLLAGMPDVRVRAFLAVQRHEGLRKGEALGLEWGHIRWNAEGGPEVFIEQQRRAQHTEPGTLKNRAAPVSMPLSEESKQLLRELRREMMRGKALYGATRGKLAQRYVFPFFARHVDEIAKWMHEACPEEFPEGRRGVKAPKTFHRLRHVFCTEVVQHVGVEAAKGLTRHKYVNTVQLYANPIRGKYVDKEALKKVRQAAQQQVEPDTSEAISLSGSSNIPGRQ